MTEDDEGSLHADGALEDARAQRHFVVKFPRGRTRSDALVLAMEAPYLEVVRELGLRCGEPLTFHDPGVLFVPRFDRARHGEGVERKGMESAYALLGMVEAGALLDFEALCAAMAAVVDDPGRDVVELVLRDACSMALGNPDNHGRNTSLLKHADGSVELSPVYDFAPMYLDPEGIRRQTRWRSERRGGIDYNDVCVSLDELVDRATLATAMRDLGERLEDAPRIMRDCGVEPSVIEDRTRSIAAVTAALAKVEG
jgi:serine/threonine-protein kinase HipA